MKMETHQPHSRQCPFCNKTLPEKSITVQDGRSYCSECVQSLSPELYQLALNDQPLEDVLSPEEISYVTWYWIWVIIFICVTTLFATLFFKKAIAEQTFQWSQVGILVGIILGGIFFLGILLGSTEAAHKSTLPRTIRLQGGELTISTSMEERSINLEDCQWIEGNSVPNDTSGYPIQTTGLVALRYPNPKSDSERIVCCHSIETRPLWEAMFTLAKLPRHKPVGCPYVILTFLFVTVWMGAFLGHLLGYVFVSWTGRPVNTQEWFIVGVHGRVLFECLSLDNEI